MLTCVYVYVCMFKCVLPLANLFGKICLAKRWCFTLGWFASFWWLLRMKCHRHDWSVRCMTEVSAAWLKCPRRDWTPTLPTTHATRGFWKCPRRNWDVINVTEVSEAWLTCPRRDWSVLGVTELCLGMTEVWEAWLKCPRRDWSVTGMIEVP